MLAVGCFKPYDTDPQYIVCFDLGDSSTRFATLQDAVDAAEPGDTVFFCEDAVITEPNRVGRTMVWPITGYGGTTIRCFMPGSMT